MSTTPPFEAVADALVVHGMVTPTMGRGMEDNLGTRVPYGDASLVIVLAMLAALCRVRAPMRHIAPLPRHPSIETPKTRAMCARHVLGAPHSILY